MAFYKRDERKLSLYSWWTRVPARIDHSERGEAVLIDGIASSYGIPTSVEGRRTSEKWEGREKIISRRSREKLNAACEKHLFSGGFVVILLLFGTCMQWL